MTAIRVMLLVAGIVAVVALPTAEVELNGTEGIVTAVSLPVAELNVTEGGPLGRRELVAPGEQVVELEEEDCPNFMWKLGKKGEMICDFGRAQELGFVVFLAVHFVLAILTFFLFPVVWVGVAKIYFPCCVMISSIDKLTPCTRDYFRLPIAILGPFIFEVALIYLLFELIYGCQKGFGKSGASEVLVTTSTSPATQFNQGFPKIGPGDCRSSKYARVQTNAC
jgi:hypothetical protein